MCSKTFVHVVERLIINKEVHTLLVNKSQEVCLLTGTCGSLTFRLR